MKDYSKCDNMTIRLKNKWYIIGRLLIDECAWSVVVLNNLVNGRVEHRYLYLRGFVYTPFVYELFDE